MNNFFENAFSWAKKIHVKDLLYVSWIIPMILFYFFPTNWISPFRNTKTKNVDSYARNVFTDKIVLKPHLALGAPDCSEKIECSSKITPGSSLILDFEDQLEKSKNITIFTGNNIDVEYSVWMSKYLTHAQALLVFIGKGTGRQTLVIKNHENERHRFILIKQAKKETKGELFIDAVSVL